MDVTGDRSGVGGDAFDTGVHAPHRAVKVLARSCTLLFEAGSPTACPASNLYRSLACPIRMMETKRHSSRQETIHVETISVRNAESPGVRYSAADEAGDGHWACCIESSDLEIAEPIFHSWVAATCAAARKATEALSVVRPPSGRNLLVSSVSMRCSFILWTTIEERLGRRDGLNDHQAYYVNGMLGGHARDGWPPCRRSLHGPPLLPGGAPHPFEATLNLTSSSKTRSRPTALGLDRSWPRSPMRSSTFVFNVALLGSVSEPWSQFLGEFDWKRVAPLWQAKRNQLGSPERGTNGSASAPAECIARRTRRYASSVGRSRVILLAISCENSHGPSTYADEGMLHIEKSVMYGWPFPAPIFPGSQGDYSLRRVPRA